MADKVNDTDNNLVQEDNDKQPDQLAALVDNDANVQPTSTSFLQTKVTIDNRHLLRQVIIQNLYQLYYQETHGADYKLSAHEPEYAEDLEMEMLSKRIVKKLGKEQSAAEKLAKDIWEKRAELDKTIKEYATAWPLEQINPVDLQILRLALYEGFVAHLIPAKVAIDEGIELSRDFGGESDIRFVSGVLGNIYATLPHD
jgi:N utilization substance protein B